MDNDKLRRIALYRATMATVKKMLDAGVLTPEEYAEIDTNIAFKYGLSLSVIFR